MGKRSRRLSNVTPTQRDRAIFVHIGIFGLATLEQLQRLFWPNAKNGNTNTTADRLMQLVRAGFLKTETTDARKKPERVFSLTRTGAREVTDSAVRQTLITKQPARAEITHTLDMAEYVEWIKNTRTLVRFTHEHQLKSERAKAKGIYHVGDGEVVIEREGVERSYIIEADGQYYGKRLQAKVGELAQSGRNILWFVKSKRRFATISKMTQQIKTIRPIFFSPDRLGI